MSKLCRAGVALLVVASCGVAPPRTASGADPSDAPPSAAAPAALEVVYDAANDAVSVQARGVPLDRVLREISAASSVAIDLPPGGEPLRAAPSLDLDVEAEPLEGVLRRLLDGFNWAALRGPTDDSGTSAGRLARVIVTSEQATGAAAPQRGAGDGPRPPASLLDRQRAEFVRALIENPAAVEAVQASGPREVARAVAALTGALDREDLASPGAAVEMVRVLHELAPERALATLRAWLADGDAPARQAAAAGLGMVGGEAAVELLRPELAAADDPLARQVAASSLARIGTPGAVDALLGAYRSGDEELGRAAAAAIARDGDATAQQALAELLLGAPVPDGTAPREVIMRHLSEQEAGADAAQGRQGG